MKKILIICSFLFCFSLLISGCTSSNEGNDPKTLEELKDKKINNPSEYDKCLKEIEQNKTKETQCVIDKLIISGYNDEIDCIENSENETCVFERYNAQVYAINDCQEEFKGKLTILDCAELIGK